MNGVLFAYRTSKQKSTGYTPFYLLYGRQAKLPVECTESADDQREQDCVAADIEDESEVSEVTNRLTALVNIRTTVFPDASSNIQEAQARQKQDYERRHKSKRKFQVGEKVLLWNLRRADRKGGRSVDPWLGPYEVTSVTEMGLYELQSETGEVLKKRQHGVNLKLFNDREEDMPSARKGHADVPTKEEDKSSASQPHTDASTPDMQRLETDATITKEENSETFAFNPTNTKWRLYQCQRMGIVRRKNMKIRRFNIRLGQPDKLENVAGDGNCFFRCISRELSGCEENHAMVRDAVVAMMKDSSHHNAFSSYVGRPCVDYLNMSAMIKDGTWATDTEIVATATLLQTSIYIYSKYGSESKWLRYQPLFPLDNCKKYEENIYLLNTNDHFKRVMECTISNRHNFYCTEHYISISVNLTVI